MADNQWTLPQRETIVAWMRDKWGDFQNCDKCGHAAMFLSPSPGHIVVGGNDGSVRLGESYPCIVLTCSNCGNMRLVNSLVAKIPTGKEAANG